MRKEEFFEVLGNLDDDIVKGVESTMKEKINIKAKKSSWLKWCAMAACMCLVVVGAIFIHNTEPEHKTSLNYNEVSSVMSGGAPVSAHSATVETTAEEVSKLLGYDIDSCIPSAMKSYGFKYTAVQNTDTNEVLGIIVTGRADGDSTTRPGIWVEVSFGTKPMIDYDYENEKMVYSIINGVEICAAVVPETTYTTASGEVKTQPAVYTAAFEQGENFYYIESRGALEQVIFDEFVCSLVEAVVALDK